MADEGSGKIQIATPMIFGALWRASSLQFTPISPPRHQKGNEGSALNEIFDGGESESLGRFGRERRTFR